DLVLSGHLIFVELELPAAMRMRGLVAAWRLDDTVEGHELRLDDFSHDHDSGLVEWSYFDRRPTGDRGLACPRSSAVSISAAFSTQKPPTCSLVSRNVGDMDRPIAPYPQRLGLLGVGFSPLDRRFSLAKDQDLCTHVGGRHRPAGRRRRIRGQRVERQIPQRGRRRGPCPVAGHVCPVARPPYVRYV